MGRVAEVLSFERVTDESGARVEEVKVDPGGDAITTAEHFAPSGDDSPPLPGDFAALEDTEGAGREQCIGYHDPKNEGKAATGECRRYARDANGVPVCEWWLRANGDVEITSIKAGGKVVINGVEIDQQGNVIAPGEVTAMGAAAPVKLSTHLHPTAMGPTSPPTPGT